MSVHPKTEPALPAHPPAPPYADPESWKTRIANALWTEIHWLIPRDRKVRITVDGDDIQVAFDAPRGGHQGPRH